MNGRDSTPETSVPNSRNVRHRNVFPVRLRLCNLHWFLYFLCRSQKGNLSIFLWFRNFTSKPGKYYPFDGFENIENFVIYLYAILFERQKKQMKHYWSIYVRAILIYDAFFQLSIFWIGCSLIFAFLLVFKMVSLQKKLILSQLSSRQSGLFNITIQLSYTNFVYVLQCLSLLQDKAWHYLNNRPLKQQYST